MTEHDSRPPHQRLETFAAKHLVAILKELSGGSIGFDPWRDARTASKEACAAYIHANWTPEQIDDAHRAACAKYGDGHGFKGRRRGRRSFQGARAAGSDNAASDSAAASAEVSELAQAADEAKAISDVIEHASKQEASEMHHNAASNANDAGAQIAALIQSLAAGQIDEKRVRAIVGDAIGKAMADIEKRLSEASAANSVHVNVVELKQGDLPPASLGMQHEKLPLLLKVCNARLRDGHRLNAWLAGPAGTGKTTAAKTVSAALGLPFYFNGAVDSPYKLTGFIDAQGRVVRTPFRDAWENGGVYLFDEVDASAPGAILEFNAALANGVAAFPDKIIPRHPDCIVIAGANTTGLGASLEYVGRMKQDAAFLDRFVVIEWPLDEALEDALCANKDWTKRVRDVRSKVKARGVKGALVTPRATIYGEALLSAGIDQSTVEALTLRKGMSADQWSQIQ